MKLKFIVAAFILSAAFSSCKKDLASSWVGTYNGTAGSNTFNQVVVSKVNDNTVKMELKSIVLGTPVAYATVGSAKLTNSTTASISEDGTVLGYSGTWHFTGTGTRDGNTLNLNGAATQTGQSTLYYTFTGSK